DHSSVGNSPGTIAASHVLHRFLVPRHPPCALTHLHTTPDARVHYAVLNQQPVPHPPTAGKARQPHPKKPPHPHNPPNQTANRPVTRPNSQPIDQPPGQSPNRSAHSQPARPTASQSARRLAATLSHSPRQPTD